MVKADFSGNFLSYENCPDKTIVTITGKPVVEERNGKWGDYLETNMEVEFLDKKKVFTPSKTSGNKMVVAWGEEMDDWVGKQFEAKHVLKSIPGEKEPKTIVEAYPKK